MNRPFRLRILRACAVLLLALAAVCRGQNAEEPRNTSKPLSATDTLPELPVDGLLDEGNVFRTEEKVQVVADIENFRTGVGIPLYVVTANYIHGDTVDNYGERLLNEGLKGRAAIVMIYERGSGRLQYSAPAGTLGRAEDMRQLFQAASRAAGLLPEEATRGQRMRAAVQALTIAAMQWKKTGALPPPPTEAPPLSPEPEKKDNLTEAPRDFLLDEADAFDAPEESALRKELMKFHIEHDMEVYVVTKSFIPEQTAQMLADKLAPQWLPERYGAVVVMNRGTSEGENPLGMALARSNEQIFPENMRHQIVEYARTKGEEERNRPDGSVSAGVLAAARGLMESLGPRGEAARAARKEIATPRQWSVMTGVVAALLVGATLLFAFHRIQERLETRSNEQFRFPDVTTGRRLGALQGGGNVAGISFGRRRE